MKIENKKLRVIFSSMLIITVLGMNFVVAGTNHAKKAGAQTLKLGRSKVVFANIKEGTKILASNDEYFNTLSKFDYAAKFKSGKRLNIKERTKFYSKVVLNWDDKNKSSAISDIKVINSDIQKMNLKLPKEIVFIRTNGSEEGEAAYTRKNAIIFPKQMTLDKQLITHELFHVFSRYNKNLRDKLYGIIHFKKCSELKFPKELKDLTIANPDAPLNNYYITGHYKSKEYSFIPIIYSTEPYNMKLNQPFFCTLRDDMLAVKIVNSKPIVIYEGGKPLIVEKSEISDFASKTGDNTKYSYSPEETMADNFMFLVLGYNVPSKWVINQLKSVIEE